MPSIRNAGAFFSGKRMLLILDSNFRENRVLCLVNVAIDQIRNVLQFGGDGARMPPLREGVMKDPCLMLK